MEMIMQTTLKGIDWIEKEERLEQHAINLRTTSYLSKQQYRKTMNKVYGEVWIIQAGHRMIMDDWLFILILSLADGVDTALRNDSIRPSVLPGF